jgi:hypothetical protein
VGQASGELRAPLVWTVQRRPDPDQDATHAGHEHRTRSSGQTPVGSAGGGLLAQSPLMIGDQLIGGENQHADTLPSFYCYFNNFVI